MSDQPVEVEVDDPTNEDPDPDDPQYNPPANAKPTGDVQDDGADVPDDGGVPG